MSSARITAVRAATITHRLPEPIVFGKWVMDHREFCLVRVDSDTGHSGFAYCLTRDGPVAAIIDRTVAPVYTDADATDPETVFFEALWSNNSIHAAGVGLRALSLVDVAAWDLAAKVAGEPMATYLGGKPEPMTVTAIVGYPPSRTVAQTVEEIGTLWDAGWRRFKMPIGLSRDESIARLTEARKAYPDAWLGIDANFLHKTAADAIEFGKRMDDLDIGWFEDMVPPGDAQMVRDVRDGIKTPIAMGDEQGGVYHPQALLAFDAVEINRVDVTTYGGITRVRSVADTIRDHGNLVSPHMYPQVHSRVLGGLGHTEAPIEWGIVGNGVGPMDDPLEQPTVREGRMDPLTDEPGLGRLVDTDWVAAQERTDDPDDLLADI